MLDSHTLRQECVCVSSYCTTLIVNTFGVVTTYLYGFLGSSRTLWCKVVCPTAIRCSNEVDAQQPYAAAKGCARQPYAAAKGLCAQQPYAAAKGLCAQQPYASAERGMVTPEWMSVVQSGGGGVVLVVEWFV